jgi:hypothetical protein
MVWIELKGSTSSGYVDVTKICAITGFLNEKKSTDENNKYILEGSVNLYADGYFALIPVYVWEYNMGTPKINNRIKNSDKQKEEIDKWKHLAFKEAKFKHDQRIFKIVHFLENLKHQKEKHIAVKFGQFLATIDSSDL